MALQSCSGRSFILRNRFCKKLSRSADFYRKMARRIGGVSQCCQTAVERIKHEKVHRYAIFDVRRDMQIRVGQTGSRDAEYEDFKEEILSKGEGECCYGIFDYNSPIAKKVFLLMYTPECAQLQKRQIYRRGFMALKSLLKGVQKFIIGTDPSDICQDSLEEKLRNPDPVLTFAPNPRGSRFH